MSERGGANIGTVKKVVQTHRGKPESVKVPAKKAFPSSKMTEAADDRADKKAGIKEGSKKDRALDKSRGIAENDAPKKRKRMSAIAKETNAIKARMKKRPAYA